MKGSALEGLSGEKRERSYEPGNASTYDNEAKRLVEEFLDINLDRMLIRNPDKEVFWQNASYLETLIPDEEDFDAQQFLDAVILRLACSDRAERGTDARNEPEWLLEPLVQALYEKGYNGLTLDPSPLPRKPGTFLAYMEGSKDNPLAVIFDAELKWYGNRADNCELTVRGVPSSFEHNCFDCSFYLEDVKYSQVRVGHHSHSFFDCRFKDGVLWVNENFYMGLNRLFVKDEEDEWKEVLRK